MMGGGGSAITSISTSGRACMTFKVTKLLLIEFIECFKSTFLYILGETGSMRMIDEDEVGLKEK